MVFQANQGINSSFLYWTPEEDELLFSARLSEEDMDELSVKKGGSTDLVLRIDCVAYRLKSLIALLNHK